MPEHWQQVTQAARIFLWVGIEGLPISLHLPGLRSHQGHSVNSPFSLSIPTSSINIASPARQVMVNIYSYFFYEQTENHKQCNDYSPQNISLTFPEGRAALCNYVTFISFIFLYCTCTRGNDQASCPLVNTYTKNYDLRITQVLAASETSIDSRINF